MSRLAPLRLWTRESVAIDLGTARTRIRLPDRDVCVEAPSVLASDGWGAARLVGREAWAWPTGQRYAPDAPLRLVWPMHAGVVSNGPACGQLVDLILRGAGRRRVRRARVLLGVPAGASSGDREAAATAVAEAAGGTVTTVDEPLAAAMGAGVDVAGGSARLLVDIGAGVTEVAMIGPWSLLAARPVPRGAAAFTPSLGGGGRSGGSDVEPPRAGGDALHLVVAAVTEVLQSLPARQRRAVAGRGLVLTGGGALVPGLPGRLSAAAGMTVTTAPGPTRATVDGLAGDLQRTRHAGTRRPAACADVRDSLRR